MPTGEPRNLGLQQQLQGVLDQMRKEDNKRLARRVKAEEKICLDQKQSAYHAREVRAWEGTKIFIREKPDGKERKVHCCRVGRTFLNVQSEDGGEPQKVRRSGIVSIRTPEERLLAILDDKIVNACKQFNRELNSLASFRSRVHSVLVRKGLILSATDRQDAK